ncbi:hypothetical protein D3C73_1295700 [compost metagenome]
MHLMSVPLLDTCRCNSVGEFAQFDDGLDHRVVDAGYLSGRLGQHCLDRFDPSFQLGISLSQIGPDGVANIVSDGIQVVIDGLALL